MATQEQIWSAADELVARGERPTLVAVRRALGGGSYTTISEGLKTWRARGPAQAQVEAPEIPDAVRDTMQRALQSVWQAASEAARAEVESARTALEARERTFTQERAEALELADELSRELETARAESEHLRAELQRVQSAADQADGRARAREEQIKALDRDLREARASLAQAQMRGAEMDARYSQAGEAIQHLEVELAATKTELDKRTRLLTEAQEAGRQVRQAAEELRLENARLQERMTATEHRADEWRAEAERLQALWAQWTAGQASAAGPEPPEPHGPKRRDRPRRKTPKEG
jgi:chromosome segregation ATPase